ncbi:alpha/beta fold hydrolase [Pseudonocardia hispaniensis]|uniref:Alpha/beta fold hydrolase n=1 Tax=Pseudonocardia hispaniensis TaxID=904933 RepID=A0ABW1IZK3_9PSEU
MRAPDLPNWLAEQLPFERYVVDIGDHRLHVMESGEGRAVVLLHGNPTWGFLYRKVALQLADQPVRVVMPDLVGFGFSSRAHFAQHTLVNHATWFGMLLDELELDDMVFMGQDWGGAIGTLALSDRADRLAGLVLANTAVTPPREGFRPTLVHRLAGLPVVSNLLVQGVGFPQLDLNLFQGDRRSIRGNVARAYRHPLRSWQDRAAVLAMARAVPDSLEHPSVPGLRACAEFVSGFTGPAAIVWGNRDPILGKLKHRTARMLPRAAVTSTSAGHFLQEQVPAEIAGAIMQVVRSADVR